VSALQDLRRDWRRWNAAEHIGAAVVALPAIGVPAVRFIAAYPL
jgi:hypothetical protein